MATSYEQACEERSYGDPHLDPDEAQTPILRCQECGRFHESVDPFVELCIECEEKVSRRHERRTIAVY